MEAVTNWPAAYVNPSSLGFRESQLRIAETEPPGKLRPLLHPPKQLLVSMRPRSFYAACGRLNKESWEITLSFGMGAVWASGGRVWWRLLYAIDLLSTRTDVRSAGVGRFAVPAAQVFKASFTIKQHELTQN